MVILLLHLTDAECLEMVEWNEQISKDWAVKSWMITLRLMMSPKKAMLKSRLGCVGASYGGYSAFYLAGIHNNRFKTFIAHDGYLMC
jgi:S-formylglutathione hydrolase FrmB